MSCQRGRGGGDSVLPGLLVRRGRERWHRVLVLSAVTGAITGLAITGFDWLTARTILEWVYGLPRLAQVLAPAVGLLLAFAALRWLGGNATPSTSDEYLRAYHDPDHPLDVRSFPARLLASIATLGFGGAMGFEGPSIYIGASIGASLERWFGRFLTRDDLRLLLVAGAAAGVAAIFKAPATGAIFAIEVPFQEDTAAHASCRLLWALHRRTWSTSRSTAPPRSWRSPGNHASTPPVWSGPSVLVSLRGSARAASRSPCARPRPTVAASVPRRESPSVASVSPPSRGSALCSSTRG